MKPARNAVQSVAGGVFCPVIHKYTFDKYKISDKMYL